MEASSTHMVRCEFCGAVSRLGHLFERWPTGLRTRADICPRCRTAGGRRWRFAGCLTRLGVLGVLGFAWAVGGGALAFRWTFGLFVLPVLLIVAHESMHAVAGLLAGARVFEVRIGWGRAVREFRLGRLRVSFTGNMLHGGACVAAFLRPPASPWRYAVLYGTPMVLHLVAIVAVLPGLAAPWPLAHLGIAHFFVLDNVLLLLVSARPIDYAAGTHAIPNDGKALLLLRSPGLAEEWFRRGTILPALYALADGDREQSIAHAWRVEGRFPDDPLVGRMLFTAYWALGCYADALRFVGDFANPHAPTEPREERLALALGAMSGSRHERWLRAIVCLHGGATGAALEEVRQGLAGETYPEGRALLLALLANVHLLGGGSLDEATRAAREAFELLPWVSFVCDAYAAVLIRSGETEKGLLLLEEAEALEGDTRERSVRDAWRAIAHAGRGEYRAARRCLSRARPRGLEIGPPPALLRMAEAAYAAR